MSSVELREDTPTKKRKQRRLVSPLDRISPGWFLVAHLHRRARLVETDERGLPSEGASHHRGIDGPGFERSVMSGGGMNNLDLPDGVLRRLGRIRGNM